VGWSGIRGTFEGSRRFSPRHRGRFVSRRTGEKAFGIETLQANTLDVRCPVESLSLLYLNPPYDFEAGQTGNQQLELVFLEHTFRWLKPGGVLIFVIPQLRLQPCALIPLLGVGCNPVLIKGTERAVSLLA
jgi:hypothetical protein